MEKTEERVIQVLVDGFLRHWASPLERITGEQIDEVFMEVKRRIWEESTKLHDRLYRIERDHQAWQELVDFGKMAGI